MKYTKAKKVGKKKYNTIINNEVSKIEAQRPPRVRRNGKEINQEAQEPYIQDIEEITSTAYTTIKPTNKGGRLKVSYLNTPCIYLLYKNDKIVYVGQTKCLAKRISDHIVAGKDFDNFAVHSFVKDEYTRLKKEEILIRKYKPVLNIKHK